MVLKEGVPEPLFMVDVRGGSIVDVPKEGVDGSDVIEGGVATCLLLFVVLKEGVPKPLLAAAVVPSEVDVFWSF